MFKKYLPLLLLFTFCYGSSFCQSQTPIIAVKESVCIGGTNNDGFSKAINTKDSGFITVGYTRSTDIAGAMDTFVNPDGANKIWLVKFDKYKKIQWQTYLYCTQAAFLRGICEDDTNGYWLVGTDDSSRCNANKADMKGKRDVVILRLDGNGKLLWKKYYGGSQNDDGSNITQLKDGNMLITAVAQSQDGDIAPINTGGQVFNWVFKINKQGNIIYQQAYFTGFLTGITDVVEFPNADILYVAAPITTTGNYCSKLTYTVDIWLFKTDSAGKMLWQNCYQGNKEEIIRKAQVLKGGDILLIGESCSNDGYFTGLHLNADDSDIISQHPSACFYDIVAIRIDSLGNRLWQRYYGGFSVEYFSGRLLLQDSTIIIGSNTTSKDSFVTNPFPGNKNKAWLLNIDLQGNIIWQKTFGGSSLDGINTMCYDYINHSPIAIGFTTSYDYDVKGKIQDKQPNFGDGWYFTVDMHKYIAVIANIDADIKVYPNPATTYVGMQLKNIAAVRLIDVLGRVILSKSISPQTVYSYFNLPKLIPGMYFIQAQTTNGNLITKKLMIL